MPFSVFLKKYFAANKKHGSRDRKQIAALCYNFYRLGKAMPGAAIEEKIITAVFLCEHSNNEFLQFHRAEWNETITKPLAEKMALTGFDADKVFSWINELSKGVDPHALANSFFYQPDLFLRIRPGKKDMVVNKLQDAGLSFNMPDGDCIALPNATKLDAIVNLGSDAVIQDLNSQKALDYLKKETWGNENSKLHVWDCCAASGGKSILAYDILGGKVELAVSDIRESILANLEKRFAAAGIKKHKSFVADLTSFNGKLPADNQLIICDAPCTGSGTWSRTPEQLYFFKEEMTAVYAEKQKKIVSNVIPHLRKEGLFIYITCSVFKKENEEAVSFIREKFHLQLLQMEFLKGYDKKADSMFVAVLQR